MKHRLSFATINFLSDSIVEMIIDDDIEITIEMLEEYDLFLDQYLGSNFAMLINRINSYHCTFEAKMIAVSHGKLYAIAVVIYNKEARKEIDALLKIRAVDTLNLKVFSGLELGWQQGYEWLQDELKSLEA
ncbi:MAG: hypothetical protein V5789_08200 [Colwellia sp.]